MFGPAATGLLVHRRADTHLHTLTHAGGGIGAFPFRFSRPSCQIFCTSAPLPGETFIRPRHSSRSSWSPPQQYHRRCAGLLNGSHPFFSSFSYGSVLAGTESRTRCSSSSLPLLPVLAPILTSRQVPSPYGSGFHLMAGVNRTTDDSGGEAHGLRFLNDQWNNTILNGKVFTLQWNASLDLRNSELGLFKVLYPDQGVVVYQLESNLTRKLFRPTPSFSLYPISISPFFSGSRWQPSVAS